MAIHPPDMVKRATESASLGATMSQTLNTFSTPQISWTSLLTLPVFLGLKFHPQSAYESTFSTAHSGTRLENVHKSLGTSPVPDLLFLNLLLPTRR